MDVLISRYQDRIYPYINEIGVKGLTNLKLFSLRQVMTMILAMNCDVRGVLGSTFNRLGRPLLNLKLL